MSTSARWLAVIVGLHLLLGLLYDRATPVMEAPDEGTHYAFIHWLAHGNPLPVQDRSRPDTTWAQEGSQPPLYYAFGAGLTAGVDTSDFTRVLVPNPLTRMGIPGTTHNVNRYRHPLAESFLGGSVLAMKLVRWFSLTLSALTIVLTFLLARSVFPHRDGLALLAAAFVAFNPMALFINASVNNDNLLMLLSTAGLLGIVHFVQPGVKNDAWKAVGLGLLLGLAALTKVSGLILWPVGALGVAWGAWRGRDLRRFALSAALMAAVAIAICGWWYWRNYTLYGDWLGMNTMAAIAGARPPGFTLGQLSQEWSGFWLSYWAVFGVFTILAAPWVYLFFDALSLWAVVGGVWAAIRACGGLCRRVRPELAILLLFSILTFAGLVQWSLLTAASQGRLMFGAIAPLSILMAAGILTVLRRGWERQAGLALSGALAVVAGIVPLAFIAPRYAPPVALAASELPGDLRPVHVTFADQFELVGYTADDTPRFPGDDQPVTLYWRALKPMARDYALALHLLGQGAAEVGKIDTWPGGGLAPTSEWATGTIYADSYRIPISQQAIAPSILHLNLASWDGKPGNTLPMTTPAGTRLSSVTLTLGRLVPAAAPQFSPALVSGTTFQGGITLLGVDVGQEGTFTLYWQTDRRIPADYTVFLHLLDSNGRQVAQADGPPLGGDWPTSAWVPGQAFADLHQLTLPADLVSGRYTAQLGLYELAAGKRLPAFQQNGAEWRDDIVVLDRILEIGP